MRRLASLPQRLLLLTCLIFGVGACSIITEPTSPVKLDVDPSWVEPAWMTSHREVGEDYQWLMTACFEEFGLNPETGTGGSTVVTRLGGSDLPIAEQMANSKAAADVCNARYPFPDFGGRDATPELYTRMLQQRDCLIAHGHDIPMPPTEDVWLRNGGSWVPFSQLPNDVIMSDYGAALSRACPQSGPSWATFH